MSIRPKYNDLILEKELDVSCRLDVQWSNNAVALVEPAMLIAHIAVEILYAYLLSFRD